MGRKILVLHWRDIRNPDSGGAENLLTKCLASVRERGIGVDWLCPKFLGSKSTESHEGLTIIRYGGTFSIYLFAFIFYIRNRKNYSMILDSVTGIPWFTPLYCRKRRITIIFHIGKKETFFSELPSERGYFGVILAGIAYLAEKSISLFYRKDRFITFSKSTKEDLINMKLPEENIFVAQEGIELKNTEALGKFTEPTVVYVGRLVKNKGIEYLIEAIQIVSQIIPNVRLLIAGRGYYEKSLKEQVNNKDLAHIVSFLGYVEDSKKIEIVARSYCLVLPSLREGWATPIIEAASLGTVAIGSDVTGISETIVNGRTGFVVPFGDSESLARKLLELLSNPKLCAEMGIEAMKNSRQYDIENTKRIFANIVSNYVS